MNKKILVSLAIIGAVAAVAVGGTIAYFNDTETSTGNILVAGTLDLKVDHTRQTYNDADCKTCSVEIISDTSNMVIARNGEPLDPIRNAVLVSNPHPRWTADVGNPNAKWIWATDPTLPEDTYDTSYTFTKTFDWYGPYTGAALNFLVASDNSVVVYFNGVEIARNDGEFGYQTPISVSFTPVQGTNELKFVVTNWDQSHNPAENPAGLKYGLTINGNCGDDYFKNHCKLWGLKDLGEGDVFWNFDDVKPGDWGINVISLHAYNNDAFVCMRTDNVQNLENGLVDPEIALGDAGEPGELSQYLGLFVWEDLDGDGVYEPTAETSLYKGSFDGLNGAINKLAVVGNSSTNFGVAWCFGEQTVDHSTGLISCDGSWSQNNKAQTDKLLADLVLYAIQQRNNGDFECPDWNNSR